MNFLCAGSHIMHASILYNQGLTFKIFNAMVFLGHNAIIFTTEPNSYKIGFGLYLSVHPKYSLKSSNVIMFFATVSSSLFLGISLPKAAK